MFELLSTTLLLSSCLLGLTSGTPTSPSEHHLDRRAEGKSIQLIFYNQIGKIHTFYPESNAWGSRERPDWTGFKFAAGAQGISVPLFDNQNTCFKEGMSWVGERAVDYQYTGGFPSVSFDKVKINYAGKDQECKIDVRGKDGIVPQCPTGVKLSCGYEGGIEKLDGDARKRLYSICNGVKQPDNTQKTVSAYRIGWCEW
ncbi:hypothetical protein B0J11DRAFT_580216 [Dendryphion nanum]|uniref:Uncharacterized protein n=1 Tax=Dendryphion nanum TaxID=256645 RepID=A0A9P9DVB2_9PLEO|nr:hypothetical protein B0J11DRAFT_580216 [Dendryphion nanum]